MSTPKNRFRATKIHAISAPASPDPPSRNKHMYVYTKPLDGLVVIRFDSVNSTSTDETISDMMVRCSLGPVDTADSRTVFLPKGPDRFGCGAPYSSLLWSANQTLIHQRNHYDKEVCWVLLHMSRETWLSMTSIWSLRLTGSISSTSFSGAYQQMNTYTDAQYHHTIYKGFSFIVDRFVCLQ